MGKFGDKIKMLSTHYQLCWNFVRNLLSIEKLQIPACLICQPMTSLYVTKKLISEFCDKDWNVKNLNQFLGRVAPTSDCDVMVVGP